MSANHSADRLVMMANQMGRFFTPQRGIDTVGAITNHINRFWDPRMRMAIAAHLANGGAGLDGPVREAVSRLKEAQIPEKGLSA
jgi:formate dehydrogenase subunit delta